MDLSDDFPNKRILDAQEIIQKFDNIIKDIEIKKSIIKKIHDGIDGEGEKMDMIISDLHDIKLIIQNMESGIKNSINSVNDNINRSVQELLNRLECKIDSIHIPEPSQNVELLTFMGFAIGLTIGLVTNFYYFKK